MARKKANSDKTPRYSDSVQKAFDRVNSKNPSKPLTDLQKNILAWMSEGLGHAVVNAVAGSGKTSTIMAAVDFLTYGTSRPSILMLAFNKSIAKEINERIEKSNLRNATAKTLNGLGAGLIFKAFSKSNVKPELIDNKTEIIAKGIVNLEELDKEGKTEFFLMLPAISKLVALFKGFGFAAIKRFPTENDVQDLCDRYEIEIPEDVDLNKFYTLLFRTFATGIETTNIIDFNDQLFLPIYHNYQFPTSYKYIFIDESQDLNPIQTEHIKRLTARGARAVFVGDRNQAIYGFRGADPESIDTICRDFQATELPLSISWRCPKAVIRAAQAIVPHIQHAETAPEGIEKEVKEDDFIDMIQPGDMVLGRTCAPLVEYCMTLIRAGAKATIKGSDIGERLISLANRIAKQNLEGTIWKQIEAVGRKEVEAIDKPGQEVKADRLRDRYDTLKVLAEGCETADEVKSKIKQIFSDNVKGVILSTIHKAKGLEASRVFVIHPELLPHPMAKLAWAYQQEKNLEYVAITRATSELYWVIPNNPIKFGKRFAA